MFKPHGKHAQGAKKAESSEASDDASVETAPDAADELSDTQDEGADGGFEAEDSDAESAAGDSDEQDSPAEEDEPGDDDSEEAAPGGFVAEFEGIPKKKKHAGLKAAGITLGVLVAVVAIVYVAGAFVFTGRFLPNTTIGSYDVSMKTDEEVSAMLESIASDYQLDIVGGGFSYRTTGEGIGLSVDSASIIQAMHDDLNAWQWPMLIAQPKHDESDRLVITSDPETYEPDLRNALAAYNETATPPVNATIVFDDTSGAFVVKPEELGTQLNPDAVLATVNGAVERLDATVALSDADLVQPTVLSTDENLIAAAEMATGMVSAELKLVMGGQEVATVNGEDLSAFVTINDKLEVTFLDDEMTEWVDDLALSFDTVGTERYFTRADGKQVAVPAGGEYGWEVDSAALKDAVVEGVRSGAKTEIEVPCVRSAVVYNGPGERDWGARYIDVDLSEQHVRFYGDDGSIIWESDCISGSPDGTHNTGPGTWYVNNKESPSKLIGYENGKKIYETTVTYWMPFEYNGIGFHDATWQPSFGGNMYAEGYGSHGCINLPYDKAQSLFDLVEIGDPVVVHF